MLKVDIIIPTHKPDKKFLALLDRLKNQTIPINKIIIYNTEEKFFEKLIYGTKFQDSYKNVELYHISTREFNHGRTRNEGAGRSDADILVFMTQDAMPANQYLIEELLKPMVDKGIAVSYARQLPSEDCSFLERFTREFNYPEGDIIKGANDIKTMGIKTYFCSNVCAAYKKKVFTELGGFVRYTIFNEDMIFAAKAVKNGWKVAYAAKAEVIHSHNYSNKQQFKRNFDLAVSQADHPEVFANISSEAEGSKYMKSAIASLLKNKKPHLIIPLGIKSIYKYVGYKLGYRYDKLSKSMILHCTMNKPYWERFWDRKNIPENVHAGYGRNVDKEG